VRATGKLGSSQSGGRRSCGAWKETDGYPLTGIGQHRLLSVARTDVIHSGKCMGQVFIYF